MQLMSKLFKIFEKFDIVFCSILFSGVVQNYDSFILWLKEDQIYINILEGGFDMFGIRIDNSFVRQDNCSIIFPTQIIVFFY